MGKAGAQDDPAPLSERAVVGACGVLAVWTLACHTAVLFGASLWTALALFPVYGIPVLVAWRRGDVVAPRSASPPVPEARPLARLGAFLVGGGAVVLLSGRPVALWWLGVGLLVAGAVVAVRAPVRPEGAVSDRRREAALWGLGVACAALTLAAVRVDLDDAFYVNLAVAAADAPGAPLLAGDTLHELPELPLHHPAYRVHSWELWNAALSRLTGLPAITCFHLLSAGWVALLVPLAWARLFRRLAPGHWLLAVGALLFVLITAGDAHRWYGNFAFVRLWQGKSVFLTLLLPVVWSAAFDLAAQPTLRRWALLAASLIASIGCTSTALWAAPAAALSAAAAAAPLDRRGLQRLGWTALACAYGLAVALFLHAEVTSGRDDRAVAVPVEQQLTTQARSERRHAPGVQLSRSWTLVTGEGWLRAAALIATLVGWTCLPAGAARRFASVVPLAAWLVLLDPYTTQWVARNVSGNSTWRLLWVLPVPALLALVLAAPARWLPRPWGGLASVALLGAFALLPQQTTLAPSNGVRWSAPGLKVEPDAYRFARLLTERVPAGAAVLAPRPVSVWLPTFHGRARPLLVRDHYLEPHRIRLGEAEIARRRLLADYVTGSADDPRAVSLFREALEHDDLRAVMLAVRPATAPARASLRDSGFDKALATLDYEIWVRP